MKDVIKEYAAGIIAAVTISAILGMLMTVTVGSSRGIFNILGEGVIMPVRENGVYEAVQKTAEILSGEPPCIIYDDTAEKICTGMNVHIISYFKVTAEGITQNAVNVENIRVLTLKSSEGNEIPFDENDKTVMFENPGTYTVSLSVRDSQNRHSVTEISFCVGEGI